MSFDVVLDHKFTEQQEQFVSHVGAGVNCETAFTLAGYHESDKVRGAARLMRQPHILAAVQIEIARRLAIGAPVALKVLQEFAVDKDAHPKIRLDAAKTLLDRAGHIAPKAAAPGKAGETPLNEMTTGELRELAEKLENEIAGRAKEVSSTKAAPRTAQVIDDII